MERTRFALIVAAFAAALTPGCISVQVDWPGKAKDKVPAETGTQPQAKTDKKADGGVKQAAAFLPTGPFVTPSLPKLFAKADSAKPATHVMAMWRDKVEYLPDPTKNGAMGAGIVGQMFLYGSDMKFVPADGTLTIEMHDDTVRAGRAEPAFLGKWTFNKDVLRLLVTVDERFGKSYALFLPWPDYKADITRVKLSGRYEQEGGFPVYIPATTVTFNNNVPGLSGNQSAAMMTPLGGPPPSNLPASGPGMGMIPSTFPAARSPSTPVNIPVGGPAPTTPMVPTNAAPLTQSVPTMSPLPMAPVQPEGPGGLPPIATILPVQR